MAQEDTIRTVRLSDIDTATIVTENSDSPVVDIDIKEEDTDQEEKIGFFSFKKPGTVDSFVLRSLNDSTVSAMKKDKSFWYADEAFHKKQSQKTYSIPFWMRPGFQTFIWIVIIIAFVSFLLLYLSQGNISLFRKSKIISDTQQVDSDENIFVINYQKEIDTAIAAGDYRLATRLLYLRLLKALSEKGIIKYTQDKTNFDYLAEASTKKWYPSFFTITRHYEYAWYGQFEVNADTFEVIRREFINFEKEI